jgi:hypothetical protein
MATTEATNGRRNPVRGRNGRFRRSLDSVDRDVQAAVLHSQGLSYQEIADQLGYPDKGNAYRGVERALAERTQGDTLRAAREKRLLELDELRAALWPAILNPPPLVSRTGKIVHDDDGQVVPDVQAQVAAVSALIRASERTARLQGLDAPRRVYASVEALIASIAPADLSAYIAQRRAELGVEDVPAGERRRMLEQALAELSDEERAAGAIPVVAESA